MHGAVNKGAGLHRQCSHRVPSDQIGRPVRRSFLDFLTLSEQPIEAIGQKLTADQMRRLIGKRLEKASAAA